MCSSPDAPKPAPKLPEAPVAPLVDASASGAGIRKKRSATNSGTILTSSAGVTSSAPVGHKTLLGT